MGTITRTITVNDISELIPMMEEEAQQYRDKLVPGHEGDRRHNPHARGYAEGVEWAIAIIRDTHIDIGDGRGE